MDITRNILATALAAIIVGVLAGTAGADAQNRAETEERLATIEVRVWNSVVYPDRHYVSARHSRGSWGTLGTIRIHLGSETDDGRWRYGDVALDVPLPGRDAVRVDIRVWRATSGGDDIYVSARPEGGSWGTLGTLLPMDDQTENGRWNYGDVSLGIVPPPPLPQMLGLQFFGEFTAEQRTRYEAAIREELESAARFFRARYGLVTEDLAFQLSETISEPNSFFGYGGGKIYLRQYRIDWPDDEGRGGSLAFSTPEFGFIEPLAHEYAHALQKVALGEYADAYFSPDSYAPLWIREGMAWYLDALHNQSKNEPYFVLDREDLWWSARHWPESLTLRDMERTNWQQGVAYLAIEQLVERTSEEALFDSYRSLRPDKTWQESFRQAFKMTVDAFYEDFALWRAREAPPASRFEGMVVDPDDNPVEGIQVGALKSIPGDLISETDGWVVKSSITGPKGIFRMPAEPSKETVLFVRVSGCGDIGMLAVDGTLTRDPDDTHRFSIALEGVSGIKITLPRRDPSTLCAPDTAHKWSARRAMNYGNWTGWPEYPEWRGWPGE